MSDKRWVSKSLVRKLVYELKDYEAAAELISGSEDVFALHSKQIGDMIARIQEIPTAVPSQELKERLDNARDDINEHREWERDVLDSLPRVDDEEGLPGARRQEFAKSAVLRVKLLNEIMPIPEKWLKAQVEAFRPIE